MAEIVVGYDGTDYSKAALDRPSGSPRSSATRS